MRKGAGQPPPRPTPSSSPYPPVVSHFPLLRFPFSFSCHQVQNTLRELKSKEKSTNKTLDELRRQINSADERASKSFNDLMGGRQEIDEKFTEVWGSVGETANAMSLLGARMDKLSDLIHESVRKTSGMELMTLVGLNSFRERSRSNERGRSSSRRNDCDAPAPAPAPPDRARSSSADREALQARARASSADRSSMGPLIREAQRIARSERTCLGECD